MTKKNKITIFLIFILLFFVYILLGFITPLVTTDYTISSSKIPKAFDGYVIVQLSDFHCNEFGKDEEKLIESVKAANPDLIVLTGDFIDGAENHSIDTVETLFEGISYIAPTYFVTGNDEYYSHAPFEEMDLLFERYQITYLKNKTVDINLNGSTIKLSGLDDSGYKTNIKEILGPADTNYYNILLFHRSDCFDFVSNYKYDLVLSGHTHGGIVRLPFIGGVFGNENVMFPEYDHGQFQNNSSTLISSSGLGKSSIPRFYNPYEVVRITLQSE